MPHTVNLHPHLIPTIITSKRLDAYKSVFAVETEMELVGTYLWNLNACAALYPLLNHVEVTIRNSVDQALSGSLGFFWWRTGTLQYSSFVPNGLVPDVVKSIRRNFKGAFRTVEREKEERYGVFSHVPDHDEVVASAEFSTWEYIFDREFMGRSLIWPSLLGQVLKGPWPHKKAGKTLDAVRRDIKVVRQFRNRLSHHEPIWKAYRVVTEEDAVSYLQSKIDAVENLLAIFSGDSTNLMQKNRFFANARMACSDGELQRFKYRAQIHNIKSMSGMRRALKDGTHSITSIKIYTDRKRSFLLVPLIDF